MEDFRLREFLNNLEEGLRGEARELFKPEDFDREQYIFIDQDEATHLYLVEEGTVEANIVHGDGKLYILNFLYAGNVFGEGALYEEGVYSSSAVAREPSRVWRVSWDDLQWLASRDPLFALYLVRLIVHKLDQAYYKDRCIAGEKVERREQAFAVAMADVPWAVVGCVIERPILEIMTTDGKYLVIKDKDALTAYFDGI